MSKLAWYWHRWRAMDAGELALRVRQKFREFADARRERDWTAVPLECSGAFPKLPRREDAPEVLRTALRRDAESILAGHWKAFGHLELNVDDPPKWHCDYLAGRDLATTASAFKLNHRELPDGADIKLIWELSRWNRLVRLAQAAYVLDDERAAQKCVRWLEDWVNHNPPYRGWNWTSALESGLRLVQFAWIDALLLERAEAWGFDAELATLRHKILPPHAWFTWRHQSFGSSANNHLIGELAGLIGATARWPALAQWGAPLEELQRRWEREVLAQFNEDGGNKEQALNYHLFAWEFCWQAKAALAAAGRTPHPSVVQRLNLAAEFFWEVQVKREPWDYGDSDSAFVTPLFLGEPARVQECRDWISGGAKSPSLEYWLDGSPFVRPTLGRGSPSQSQSVKDWWWFKDTGLAICESGFWWLRWDLSPLGYLSTAAHGHLDALHLSIWFKGVAVVIDPGTGAYYGDKRLRAWLASRAAHNGPCPAGAEFPVQVGTFLWSGHHAVPSLQIANEEPSGTVTQPGLLINRRVVGSPDGLSWRVEDKAVGQDGSGAAFSVRWQFAPGTRLKMLGQRKFMLNRSEISIVVEAGEEWAEVKLVETEAERGADAPLAGIVSPAFRQTEWAPYLKLTARPGGKPCVFRTTFLMAKAGSDSPLSDGD